MTDVTISQAELARLLNEKEAAENRVKELLELLGAECARKRGRRYQVHEFHRAMGQPVLAAPDVPSDDRVRLRLRLVLEEFCELLEACGMGDHHGEEAWSAINRTPIDVDMIELADALADLDYVIEGTRLEFGIHGWPIAQEVHRSNMAKVGAKVRDDGKIQKPDGWTPPDVARELRAQGWRG